MSRTRASGAGDGTIRRREGPKIAGVAATSGRGADGSARGRAGRRGGGGLAEARGLELGSGVGLGVRGGSHDAEEFRVLESAPFQELSPLRALVDEAGLGEHAARRRIPRDMPREDAIERERAEAMLDDSARGLGRVALAPVGGLDDVAELGAGVRAVDGEADGADERAIERDAEDRGLVGGDEAGVRAEPGRGVGEGIGMRDAEGGGGDDPLATDANAGRGVIERERAEEEARGLEGGEHGGDCWRDWVAGAGRMGLGPCH